MLTPASTARQAGDLAGFRRGGEPVRAQRADVRQRVPQGAAAGHGAGPAELDPAAVPARRAQQRRAPPARLHRHVPPQPAHVQDRRDHVGQDAGRQVRVQGQHDPAGAVLQGGERRTVWVMSDWEGNV